MFVDRLTIAAANAPESFSLQLSLIASWCCPCLPATTVRPQRSVSVLILMGIAVKMVMQLSMHGSISKQPLD